MPPVAGGRPRVPAGSSGTVEGSALGSRLVPLYLAACQYLVAVALIAARCGAANRIETAIRLWDQVRADRPIPGFVRVLPFGRPGPVRPSPALSTRFCGPGSAILALPAPLTGIGPAGRRQEWRAGGGDGAKKNPGREGRGCSGMARRSDAAMGRPPGRLEGSDQATRAGRTTASLAAIGATGAVVTLSATTSRVGRVTAAITRRSISCRARPISSSM